MTASGAVTVSIITPCYNGAPFIRTTLESALGQTRPPLEIIVIDDGSTDDSATIAESIGPPVRVIRQSNRGESSARNRGISEARGTHVLFLDADDVLAPEALERLCAAITDQPDAVALMGCGMFERDPGSPFREVRPSQREFFPAIIESNFAPPHCWLSPLALIRRAGGFHEPLRWFEDWDLWWRVAIQEPSLVPVDYVGGLYRQHAQSQLSTTKPADRARGHAWLMERMAAAFLERQDLLARHGDQLFWSCWTALQRARTAGVPWAELDGLAACLRRLAKEAPSRTAKSRLALTLRLFGPRVALGLENLSSGSPKTA